MTTSAEYAAALDISGLTFSSGGDAQWTIDSVSAYYGGSCVKSGVITDDQSSYLETTVTGYDKINFYWKVSSESGYDFLKIYIDGSENAAISGAIDWQYKEIALPDNEAHIIKFEYSKDSSVSHYDDCGYIDKITLIINPPTVETWEDFTDNTFWEGKVTSATATWLPAFNPPLWSIECDIWAPSYARLTAKTGVLTGIRPKKFKVTLYSTEWIKCIIHTLSGTVYSGTAYSDVEYSITVNNDIDYIEFYKDVDPAQYPGVSAIQFLIDVPVVDVPVTFDTVRNETLFRLTLSGDSGDRTNWMKLFDNTVWIGKETGATAVWKTARWDIQVGTKYSTNYASLTPAGTDFNTFRPLAIRLFFMNAEKLGVYIFYADGAISGGPAFTPGLVVPLYINNGAITKIEFRRSDVYELFPYITNMEFYDADYVPTVNDDSELPLANCDIQIKLDMKNSDGEILPAWESAENPFSNGYDDGKSIYRINFRGTVPSMAKADDFVANAGNELIFEYSSQTINGEQDWNELTFIRSELQSATQHEGAQSQSITFQAVKESLVSDYTWDYQEKEISEVSFRSPNQQDGKWTYQMAGLITGIKPGYKATYNGQSFIVGEIQYIINTTGITTYLKEY